MSKTQRIELSYKQSLAWQALESKTPTVQSGGSAEAVNTVFYGGAAGGGKTFLLCLWCLHRRLTHPGTWGMIAKDRQTNIVDTVLPTFFAVAEMLGLNATNMKFNSKSLRVTLANKSVVLFKDLEYKPSDPDFHRIGGLEITDLCIDEAQTISEKAFEIATTRIRRNVKKLGLPYSCLLTGNPGPHWLKYKFVKDIDGNPVELTKDLTFIQALVTDNPDKEFAESYMAMLQTKNEYDKARLLYGDWDAEPRTGGEFYDSFSSELIDELNYQPELALHISFDFNVHPYMTATVWQSDTKNRLLKQIDEVCLRHPRNRTAAVCMELAKRYAGHQAGLFVYGDPAGRSEDTRTEQGSNDYSIILRELARFKPALRVDSKAPAVAMRGQFINALFRAEIDGVRVRFAQHCRETIRDYMNVKQAADGGKEKKRVRDPNTGVSYEPLGHTSDANDYLICRMLVDQYVRWQSANQAFTSKLVKRSTFGRQRY